MKRKIDIHTSSAQVMLEYLVMTIMVAFIVFAALNFNKSGSAGKSMMMQAQEWYKRGYQNIVQ